MPGGRPLRGAARDWSRWGPTTTGTQCITVEDDRRGDHRDDEPPDQRNALGQRHLDELLDAFTSAGRAAATGIVLAGPGPVFSAGHDLGEMAGADVGRLTKLLDTCTELMQTIQSIPQVVVARVHGLATAAGCQLVATCDLAVAAESAAFAVPGGKGGWFCTTPMVAVGRAVSRKRALEMALTGDPIDAPTAEAWGLINRCVPDDELDAAVADLLARATRGSVASRAIGKAALYHQLSLGQDEAYAYAVPVMAEAGVIPDAQEGMRGLRREAPTRFRPDDRLARSGHHSPPSSIASNSSAAWRTCRSRSAVIVLSISVAAGSSNAASASTARRRTVARSAHAARMIGSDSGRPSDPSAATADFPAQRVGVVGGDPSERLDDLRRWRRRAPRTRTRRPRRRDRRRRRAVPRVDSTGSSLRPCRDRCGSTPDQGVVVGEARSEVGGVDAPHSVQGAEGRRPYRRIAVSRAVRAGRPAHRHVPGQNRLGTGISLSMGRVHSARRFTSLWTGARGRPVHSRARRRPGGHNVSHMVIFQTPDGNPGYNQFETVEEAVSFVEKLRNDQGIDNARMFALEEIKFELKPLLQGRAPGADAGQCAHQPDRVRQPSRPRTAAGQRAGTAAGSGGNGASNTSFGSFPPPSPEPSYATAPPASAPPATSPARRPSRFVAVCSVADRPRPGRAPDGATHASSSPTTIASALSTAPISAAITSTTTTSSAIARRRTNNEVLIGFAGSDRTARRAAMRGGLGGASSTTGSGLGFGTGAERAAAAAVARRAADREVRRGRHRRWRREGSDRLVDQCCVGLDPLGAPCRSDEAGGTGRRHRTDGGRERARPLWRGSLRTRSMPEQRNTESHRRQSHEQESDEQCGHDDGQRIHPRGCPHSPIDR